ncbi:MAG: hypothetical protein ABH863_05875 [Candidatus Micrarchaeota archaeon]
MNYSVFFAFLAAILLLGCSTLRPPAVSPSPFPEISIEPPSPKDILYFEGCPNRRCITEQAQPVLVYVENRINRTTHGARGLPFNLPECGVIETAFDKSSLAERRITVNSPDFFNYFTLYYYIPYKRGAYNVRIKTSCEVRGTVYGIDSK